MKVNPYYNKDTMNLKQLAKDLENQGYTCELSEDGDYLCVYYPCYLDYAEISLTGYKDWSVTHHEVFKEKKFYKAATNWSVIKLFRKLLIDTK